MNHPHKSVVYVLYGFREDGVRDETIVRYNCDDLFQSKERAKVVVHQVRWGGGARSVGETTSVKEDENWRFNSCW